MVGEPQGLVGIGSFPGPTAMLALNQPTHSQEFWPVMILGSQVAQM